MSQRYKTLVVGLLAAALHQVGHAQDPVQLLVEQGRYWQERGDQTRASQAWEKLLRANPEHPDALYGMAMVELAANRPAGVQKYLDELKRVAPKSPLIARLEEALTLRRAGTSGGLAQARSLAQSGEAEQAVEKYREVLGGKAPVGSLGREYYQTLGATAEGWQQAREGLEKIVEASPDDAQSRLALAQVLTYREPSRVQGIRQLAELASRPDVGKAATQSWRTALGWLGDPPPHSATALLQAYLEKNPNDAEMRKRLASIGPDPAKVRAAAPAGPSPTDRRIAAGFAALDAGRLSEAEAEFQAILQSQPNNANALGGMGVLRLRQERFSQARELLQRASARGGAARWRQPLNSASYWALIDDADTARSSGDLDEARKLLGQAVRIDSREPVGQVALGDVLAASGQPEAAEKAYRQVLSRDANNPDAIRGLVGVLAQSGKSADAMALIERLTPEQQGSIGALGSLRAQQALGEAKAAAERGDDAAAAAALQEALLNDPNNPWIRLDLARIYLKAGAVRDARAVVDGLLVTHPDLPDALYASALLAAETQDWASALTMLERIPLDQRTAAMGELQRRAWVHDQAAHAARLARQGDVGQAVQILTQAESYAQDEVDLLGALATGYVAAGDSRRALGMMRTLLARTTRPEPGLQLQYAGILAQTGQDIELAGILRQLQGADLSATERQNYQDLRYAYVVRQTDALRERGQLADAYDLLAPLLAERPEDTLAVGALARLYADAGQPAEALDLYTQVLQQNPRDLPTLMGAASVATAAGEYKMAESAVENALDLDPTNPQILATAARLYRAQGKNSKAAEYLKLAIAAEAPVAMAAGPGGAGARRGNPFVNRNGVPARGSAPFAMAAAPIAPAQAYAAAPYIPPPVAGAAQPAGAGSYAPPLVPYASVGGAGGVPASDYLPPPAAASAPTQMAAAPYFQGASAERPWNLSADTLPQPAVASRAPAARQPANRARTLRDELSEIQQERSPDVAIGTIVRSRDGESGLSGLTDVQAPMEARLPIGDGKVALRVTPVSLSTSNVSGNFNDNSRFGGGPAAALAQADGATGGPGSQSANGVGVSVAYVGRNVEADIGSTPLGFEKTDIVGGLRLKAKHVESGANFALNLSRRAVTDSLLSFAGTRDSRTGQRWGGVTASGARLDIGLDGNRYGVYGYGSWHTLQGHNVASNTRMEGGFGAYANVYKTADSELTAGLNFTGIAYDKNLRFFTYGHGGYFSPQSFYSVSVPVSWAQRSGRLSYAVRGSLGVQNFRENAARYFPTSSALQLAAQNAMATAFDDELTTNTNNAIYPGQSKTGVGYSLSAALEYQMAPQLFVGGSLATDNASDYNQWTAGFHLRYMFAPSTRPMELPVSPYASPYGQ